MTHLLDVAGAASFFNASPAVREQVECAIKGAVVEIAAWEERYSNGTGRPEAREFFIEAKQHADALVRCLVDKSGTNTKVQMLAQDVGTFIQDPSGFVSALTRLGDLAQLRAALISGRQGNFNFNDEVGFPSPDALIATFVVLLWERVKGCEPGPQNPNAGGACDAICRLLDAAGARPARLASQDPLARWPRHIEGARQGRVKARKFSLPTNEKYSRQGDDEGPLVAPELGIYRRLDQTMLDPTIIPKEAKQQSGEQRRATEAHRKKIAEQVTCWNAVEIITAVLDRAAVPTHN